MIVCGCFGGGGRLELYVLERDFEAKKHGYSTNSYLQVLNDQLPSYCVPSLVFMQDGASIHTIKKVHDWSEEIRIGEDNIQEALGNALTEA
jgi:hypothetical protein